MKGKPHPSYSRQQVRKEIARRLKAEAEVAQLRKELRLAKKAIQEMVSHNRKVEQTWMNGVAKNPTVN